VALELLPESRGVIELRHWTRGLGTVRGTLFGSPRRSETPGSGKRGVKWRFGEGKIIIAGGSLWVPLTFVEVPWSVTEDPKFESSVVCGSNQEQERNGLEAGGFLQTGKRVATGCEIFSREGSAVRTQSSAGTVERDGGASIVQCLLWGERQDVQIGETVGESR